MTTGYIFLPVEGGGAGSGNINSINGSTAANQLIVGGTNIAVVNTGATHTINLNGPIPIALGGTGQSNQQAALNNLTDIGSHSNGDVLQLLGGNAQFAPLAGASGPALTFAGFDSLGALTNIPNWSFQNTPLNGASNADLTYNPNNLAANPTAINFSVNVSPLQNSPNDSLNVLSISSNLDAAATGFSFGTNGQAAILLNGNYNYGGNGASFGVLRNINFFGGFGNGTDPGTFKQVVASSHSFNFGANITIDGTVSGYDFNVNINAAAITTSNFNVLWLSDFSQYPVDVYGYQGFVCQPNIATIKNNHNFSGASISPNITLMEGNAGFFGYQIGGTITTAGTSGYQGIAIGTNIGTVPAGTNIIGISMFNQITTMDATSSFHGINISPTITILTGNIEGIYQTFPQVTAGSGNVELFSGGLGSVHTTGNTSVLNLNGLTADGNQSQFAADNVHMNIGGALSPTSNAGIAIQHVIFTSYSTPASTAITGTDVLCNVLSPDVDFGNASSSLAIGPSGLGFAMVAFAGQMHGHGQMDLASAVIPTAIFSEDFTLGEWRNVNAYVINAGFTGTCTDATAFYHEVAGAGLFATNHWGLKVVSDVDNYVTKLAIGTANKKAAAPFVLDMVGQSQNRQVATDAGVYGHYVNLTSHTTADASNELFAFSSENSVIVDATFTNSKVLTGSAQTLARGDGSDDGTLEGLCGHQSFLKITSGAGGVTTGAYGFLSLLLAQTGTVTDVFHFRSVSIESGGTITNQYGIYLPHDSTTPLKNWLSGQTLLGAPSFAAPNANTVVTISEGHIGSVQATSPTIAPDASAGTGATASVAQATDTAGQITIVTGTIGLSTGSYATVTFNEAYAVAPIVMLTPASSTISTNVYVTSTTAGFSVNFAVAGGIAATYVLNYMVIETQ